MEVAMKEVRNTVTVIKIVPPRKSGQRRKEGLVGANKNLYWLCHHIPKLVWGMLLKKQAQGHSHPQAKGTGKEL